MKLGKFCEFIEGENTDLGISILTIAIFILPVITSLLFNFPQHMTEQERELVELEKRMEEDDEKEKIL